MSPCLPTSLSMTRNVMSPSSTPLPYGPTMTRLLPGLRRAFRAANRFTVPAIQAGFGPRLSTPATGSMLVVVGFLMITNLLMRLSQFFPTIPV